MAVLLGIVLLLALAAGLVVPLALQLRSSSLLEARLAFIRRLVSETPLIDGHSGHPSPHLNSTSSAALVSAYLWPVLVPCGSQHLDSVQLTLEKVDQVHRLILGRKEFLQTVETSEEFESVHMNGRVAVLLGIEGGHSLGDSLGVLRSFYMLGARFLTLTHECNTPWVQASSPDGPEKIVTAFTPSGLTNFGKTMVTEMNRLGMIVDLSHVSEQTMLDVLEVSQAPVVFSHSGARTLCNASQNVPDSVLSRLSLNGGVVMVNVQACPDGRRAMDGMIAHINYIRQKAGVNHVGLGGDVDEEYPLLLSELARDRNWETAAIRKLVGLNFLRVFREVETFRDNLKGRSLVPLEDVASEALGLDVYCRYPDDEAA